RIEQREPVGGERAERRVRRRAQKAVDEPHAQVARRAGRQASLVQRPSVLDDRLAQRIGHATASRKKSGPPKLPDLSASASLGSSTVVIHGTPRAISAPTCRTRMPSASTTAAEVSPPATTMRRAPASASRRATAPSRSSTAAASAASRSSGGALA